MDLHKLTIMQAHEGLVAKKFSSRELTTDVFKRIKDKDETIDAFLTICEKEALSCADHVDKLLFDNQKISLLAGVPVAVKDNIVTGNIKTTAGSKILENFIPPYDATIVQKLKNQEAVIIGKTNCDEFAMGGSTENSSYKTTKNPHNLEMVPGGSSGGSAAAVSANECIYALGTDTGGSIRQPASLCGVVGLKPTYGRASRYGLIAMTSSMDCPGPITKTVEDAACVLQAIAGPDDFDATAAKKDVPAYLAIIKKDIKNLKVGVPKEYFGDGLDAQVKKVIQGAIQKMEKQGCEIIEISLPNTEHALAAYYIIVFSEVSANMARFDGIRFGFNRDYLGDEVKRRIMLGTYSLSSGYYDQYYLKAAKVRALVKKDFDEAFQKVDVIMGPVSPTPTWKIGEKVKDPLQMYLADIYTVPINLAGVPAISVPCGFVDKLPVGLQIIGPQFGEEVVLKTAFNFERISGVTHE